MLRIRVSSASSGTPVHFTFPSNPREYEASDEANVSQTEVLHGSSVWQKKAWDDRVRILRWKGNPVDSSYVSSIYTYFKSIEGSIRYFDFRDLDSINLRWPISDTWKKARIISIKASYRQGGSLIYDNLELWIAPEQ